MSEYFPDLNSSESTAQKAVRIPPQDLAAERSLLGAMLLTRDAIADAMEVCTAEQFYRPAHGHIFEAISSLYGAG
ncbi:MAG: DnaB-like helicase N-terminal domain-containing protein, partial [Acidimicrobiales bacterium]